jgi:hypothetical protein
VYVDKTAYVYRLALRCPALRRNGLF